MMRAQLDDCHRRGEPLAYLWASEATIYGRFGYGLASQQASIALPKERTAFAQPFEPRGTRQVRRPRPRRSSCSRRSTSGFATSGPGCSPAARAWWETRRLSDDPARRRPGQGPLHLALLELDGEPAGYAIYRIAPGIASGITTAKVIVVEVIAPTPEAERELWRFVLDIDWIATIEYDYLPPDSALVLLLADPRHMKQTLSDALWVRLVDVGEALEAREPWPTRRRSCWKSRMPSARGTPAAGRSRRARSSAPTTRPTCVSTSPRSARSISAASRSATSCAASARPSFGPGPRSRPTRCSGRTPVRGAPRSSEVSVLPRT